MQHSVKRKKLILLADAATLHAAFEVFEAFPRHTTSAVLEVPERYSHRRADL